MAEQEVMLSLEIEVTKLHNAGLTPQGKDRYQAAVEGYASSLQDASLLQAQRWRENEVTELHVHEAAKSIQKGTPPRAIWLGLAEFGEFVTAAAAGYGWSNMYEKWGPPFALVCFAATLLLKFYRLRKEDLE